MSLQPSLLESACHSSGGISKQLAQGYMDATVTHRIALI
jgi:hypothetical protein